MKVYAFKFYAHQEEREQEGYEEFAEVTIECSIEELEKLAKFFNEELKSMTNYLEETKNEPENVAGEPERFYPHYRFWDKQWELGSPDFILAVTATR